MKRPKQKLSHAQREISPGDRVSVRLDDGRSFTTNAVSKPWQLGHGDWVIKVEGIIGGYALERVNPVVCELEKGGDR